MTNFEPKKFKNIWTIKDSISTYNIDKWGDKYFSINSKGNISVTRDIKSENKIDLFKDKSQILDFLAQSSTKGSFKEIVPISALRGKNINRLKSLMEANLPFQTPQFSKETITDKSTVFRISEIVREKLMKSLRDELPYSLTCKVDHMDEKNNLILIELSILLLKESHKKIVIGKNGRTLKQVGTESRKEIEKLLGKKVFLSSVVKSGQKRRV